MALNNITEKLFPLLMLKPSEAQAFLERDNLDLKKYYLATLMLMGFGHICHYYLIDIPKQLTVDNYFFEIFRFGSFASSLVLTTYYLKFKNNYSSNFFKIPIILYLFTFTLLQASTSFYYPASTTSLPYFMIITSIFIIKMQPVQSFVYMIMTTLLITIIQHKTGKPIDMLLSHSVVCITVSIALSFRIITSIKLFKFNLDHINNQKKLIERQIEIVQNLRMFLPKKIFERFNEKIQNTNSTTSDAIKQILEPKKMKVCCLFTDIRSFTIQSRDMQAITNEILPTIIKTSNIVEAYEGISRKIGDLVFAYFDDYNLYKNINNSYSAALNIAADSEAYRAVSRSIILTIGSAVVGNIGGTSGGFEITAIGNPSNMCARIDEFVKSDKKLNNSIVVSENYYESLEDSSKLYFEEYTINSFTKIRDFENEIKLFYLPFKKVIDNKINLINKKGNIWAKIA